MSDGIVRIQKGHSLEVTFIAVGAAHVQGQGCPCCDGTLEAVRGIEVGHIFKLGTFFSEALGAYFLDGEGQQMPLLMGCYGIEVGRLLAAAIEQHHDQRGILFSPPIAPYQVHLVGLTLSDAAVAQAAEDLYRQLWAQGLETLYDDRVEESAGVKLNDADLLGMPVRLVVSPRTVGAGSVEIKGRTQGEPAMVLQEEVLPRLRQLLDEAT